jgi:hypothetical protein
MEMAVTMDIMVAVLDRIVVEDTVGGALQVSIVQAVGLEAMRIIVHRISSRREEQPFAIPLVLNLF